jgi:hypothetical protein
MPPAPSPWEPPKILSYLTAENSFIISQGGRSQKSYTIRTLSPSYYGKNRLYQFFSYFILPLPPSFCTLDGGQWLYSPLSDVWWYLSPLPVTLKIINNPINIRHVKTKTNIIKSTITSIQSICTHNLQLNQVFIWKRLWSWVSRDLSPRRTDWW